MRDILKYIMDYYLLHFTSSLLALVVLGFITSGTMIEANELHPNKHK